MNNFETQQNQFELTPDMEVRIVAFLDDLGGKRYFMKTKTGQCVYLDQSLDNWEVVDDSAVASAVIKHGYKPMDSEFYFAFGQRKEILLPEKPPSDQ